MRRALLLCGTLLAGAVLGTGGTASAVTPGLLEAALWPATGGVLDPTVVTMLGQYITTDFPTLARADVVDDSDQVLATVYVIPTDPPSEVTYMKVNFTVDISTMHEYRLIAYDSLGALVTVSNIQSYGPPPGPASLAATATLDTSSGYTHLVKVTWDDAVLPSTISQFAMPGWYRVKMRNQIGRLVAYGAVSVGIGGYGPPPYALTFGVPYTTDGVQVTGTTIRPGQYTIRAWSIPAYTSNQDLWPVPLAPPTTTTITVPPEPAALTIADPPTTIDRGQRVLLHGRLRAKYSDLPPLPTKVRVFVRGTRTEAWRLVDTVLTGKHGRYTFAVVMRGDHQLIRTESVLTTRLRPASAWTRLAIH